MPRPTTRCGAAVLAVLLLAAAAPRPAAAGLSASERALYQELAGGLAAWSQAVVTNKFLPDPPATNASSKPVAAAAASKAATPAAASAAAAPAGATPASVAKAIGTIMAAAALDAEAASSLGDPRKWM